MRLALLIWLVASTALAAEPCTGEATELGVAITVDPGDDALIERIERHLRAALRPLSLCAWSGPAGALEITLDVNVNARIVVRDALTRKQLERTLELGALPADSRALAIAAAADELLRASWAELLLRDAPPPSDAPKLLSVAKKAVPRVHIELGLEGGARLSADRHAAALAFRVGSWFRSRWAAHASFRGELADERNGTHGSVRGNAVALALLGSHAFVPIERRLGLSADLGTALALLWFRAHANDSGLASSFTRGAWRLDGHVRGWWGPPSLRASLAAGVSWTARPARAFDEQRVVTADRGVAGELTLGVASLF